MVAFNTLQTGQKIIDERKVLRFASLFCSLRAKKLIACENRKELRLFALSFHMLNNFAETLNRAKTAVVVPFILHVEHCFARCDFSLEDARNFVVG